MHTNIIKVRLDITASIVLYNENLEELTQTVNCFLSIPLKKKLYLIDNSLIKQFEDVFNHVDIQYISNKENIGFGAAHNLILNNIKNYSKYHLILNPDVVFKQNVILNLILELEKNSKLAMIAPKVLFPNRNHQYSCRRYPSVKELVARRFSFLKPLLKATIFNGQYRDKNLNVSFYAEYITGCFHLYKTEDFIVLNGFDERYFLYMEDVDICKKIDGLGKKKLYFPQEEIVHVLKQGSSKSLNLFFRHTLSAIKYFLKWGI